MPTLKELADQYMREHAPRKKMTSQKEDQRLWNQFILPSLGSLKVSSIERSDVSKLHHSLQRLPTTANRASNDDLRILVKAVGDSGFNRLPILI